MELFRIGGLSSEDLMVKDKMNSPQAFYGSVWKFSKDKTQKQIEQTKKVITSQKLSEQGEIVPQDLTTPVDTDSSLGQASHETEVQAQGVVIDKAYLEKLTYPEIQTIAAAEGIGNITLKKPVLIEKILEARSR